MRLPLTSGFTFTPTVSGTPGTLNFSGVSGFNPALLYIVIDVTQDQILYLPGSSQYGGTWSGSILTPAVDTTGYNNTDALLVLYEQTPTFGASAVSQTLTATANGTSSFATQGSTTFGLDFVTIPSGAILSFYGFNGSGNAVPLTVVNQATGAAVSSISASGFYWLNTAGIQNIQIVVSGTWTGTAVGYLYGTPGTGAPTPTKLLSAQLWRATFTPAYASTTNPANFNVIKLGSGQTISQSGGNLNVVAGTTLDSETIVRSVPSFTGNLIFKYQLTASQRIANNNLFVELVDVIGDGLAYTINSATSVTVTFPSTTLPDGSTLSSVNVGQFMYLGALTTANTPGGRSVIASVSGAAVTFTVAGFPASGSGTCSVFGWNYYQIVYNGTTATNNQYDAQGLGYNSGFTTNTISTTASPGHINVVTSESYISTYEDMANAVSPTTFTSRAQRFQNIPAPIIPLYIQIRSLNGTTAPATSTTFTLGFIGVEMINPIDVSIGNVKPQGNQMAGGLPVVINNIPNVFISSGTVTAAWLGIPNAVTDAVSAAITSTATTAAIMPTQGVGYIAEIDVTAVTGTTPTMDVVILESDDSGTNYNPVYQFPRITANGNYRSPPLTLTGNRIEYLQTLTGTTPSFTRSVTRLQTNITNIQPLKQLIANAPVLTALGTIASFGGTYTNLIAGLCRNAQIIVAVGTTAFTTAAVLQLQGSDDGGVSWYNIGATLSTGTVASVTSSLTINNINAALLRVSITTAGVAGTAVSVILKAF